MWHEDIHPFFCHATLEELFVSKVQEVCVQLHSENYSYYCRNSTRACSNPLFTYLVSYASFASNSLLPVGHLKEKILKI